MLKSYLNQWEKIVKWLFYVVFTLIFCLIIKDVQAAGCNQNYNDHDLATAPTGALCDVGTASPLYGSWPWAWSCTDSASTVWCFANTSPAKSLSVTCSPASLTVGTNLTSLVCRENHGYPVKWSGSGWLDGNCTWSDPILYTEYYSVMTVNNLRCLSPVQLFIQALSGSATSAAIVPVTTPTTTSLILTPSSTTPTINQSISVTASCNGTPVQVEWWPSQCAAWPASNTFCTFTTSGPKTITATPVGSSTCSATSRVINVVEPWFLNINCAPSTVTAGNPVVCSTTEPVSWSFSDGTLGCNTTVQTTSVTCPISPNHVSASVTVTALQGSVVRGYGQFLINSAPTQALNISCTPSSISPGGTVTCRENNNVSVDWSFGGGLTGCNISGTTTAICTIPPTQTAGLIQVTATKSGYTNWTTVFNVSATTTPELSISCAAGSVLAWETITCKEDNGVSVSWSFGGGLTGCNISGKTVPCTIPQAQPAGLVQVTATKSGYTSGFTSFYVNAKALTALNISCTPSSISPGGTVTCRENNNVSVNWNFGSSFPSCNVAGRFVACTIPLTQTAGLIQVNATQTDYIDGYTSFNVVDAQVKTLSISCSPGGVQQGQTVTCKEDTGVSVDWSFGGGLTGCNISGKSVTCAIPPAQPLGIVQVTATQSGYANGLASFNVLAAPTLSLSILCSPGSVQQGQTVTCQEENNLSVSWSFGGGLTNCNVSGRNATCTIPTAQTIGIIQVTATKTGYEEGLASFNVTERVQQTLSISCLPGSVQPWQTVACKEDTGISVDWAFGNGLSSCNASGKNVSCFVPLTQSLGIIPVTATKTDYLDGDTSFSITERTLSDLVITCDSEKLTGKAFSCAATCGGKAESVTWWPSQCVAGPSTSTSCTFINFGPQIISATPLFSSNCRLTSTSISIEQSETAKVTCTWPFRIDEPFACTVTCDEESVPADWSIASAGTNHSCTPASGTSTQCRTDAVATVTAANAGHCNTSSAAINLTYHDLSLSCSPTTVHSSGGETFTCTAAGGDQEYTWLFPSIVHEETGSTDTLKTFSIQLPTQSSYPTDGTITIKLQDGHNAVKEIKVELLPPGIYIEEIYKVGNAGIQVGATEDLYFQLNAVGGLQDMQTIQAKLLKGSCANSTTCANKQIFNVVTSSAQLTGTEETGSGVNLLYNLLYKLPVLIPDYEDLINGDYTYAVTVYDIYNQQTTAYLSTYIGTLIDGDINGDQSIDILDIVKTVMYYLNPSLEMKASERDAIDFNNNQQIDLTDVIKVIQEAMKE